MVTMKVITFKSDVRPLRQMSGPEDTPARFGGDELAIIVMNRSDEDVIQLAQNIQSAVQQIRLSTDSAFLPQSVSGLPHLRVHSLSQTGLVSQIRRYIW